MTVVSALLWAAALVAALWILVPAIAFALNIGGLRTDILPDAGPPTLYSEDSVFGPRLRELAALGFRMAARTVERGRFISPIHWRWEAYEAQQWLVSPDGRTHATLYRVAEGEPARISTVTVFEDGGFVRTSCPGGGAKEASRPNYWRFDLLGVDAAGLVARHQEQVEAFARERGTRAKAATIAEIAAADNAAEWPIVRKMSVSSYGMLAFFLPALFVLIHPARAIRGLPFAPIEIGLWAGFYGLVRWWFLGPRLRENAKLSHKHDLSNPAGIAQAQSENAPKDIAEDGRILATGKNERRLRLLAMPVALLWCVWTFVFARAMVLAFPEKTGAIIFLLPFLALAVLTTVQFAGRARGRLIWTRKDRWDPVALWPWSLGLIALFMSLSSSSNTPFHRFVVVIATLSGVLACIGWGLEKKRGK